MSKEEYIKNVKSNLECNCSNDYVKNYVTYTYTNEEVDDNLDYFNRCKSGGLSPYKSLLFFGDYKEGDYDI